MKSRGILLVGIALLALSSSSVKWLIENGGELGLKEPGSISFCNVLFLGNLLAGILVGTLFGPRKIFAELRGLTLRDHGLLGVNVIFAVAIPMLLFTALAKTSVTNVVLLGRIESVVYALLAFLIGGAALGRLQLLGYAFITGGIVLLVLVQGMFRVMEGDTLVAIAAVLQAVAAVLVKKLLKTVSIGAFVFVRNFASAIIFFVFAMTLYGFSHFAHAFRGDLWLVMAVYALVIVVIGQWAWYRGLGKLPAETVANLSMLTPFLGVLFAFLLLGERPVAVHWIGGGIIFAGMLVIRFGAKKGRAVPPAENSLAGA